MMKFAIRHSGEYIFDILTKIDIMYFAARSSLPLR